MSDTQFKQGLLGCHDADFWAGAEPTFQTKSNVAGCGPGLLLDGPQTADCTTRRTIPYMGAWSAAGGEHLTLTFEGKAVLVGLCQNDGRFAAGPISRQSPSDDPIPVSRKPSEGDDGVVLEFFETNLARIGLTLQPGIYKAWAVLFDRASNPVTTEVTGPVIVDPEVQALVDQSRRELYAGPVMPPAGDPLPDYSSNPLSPRLPSGVGLSLNAPRVTVARPTSTMTVRGSFRLPIIGAERVHPGLLEQERRWRDEALPGTSLGPLHDAVVNIYLVLIGNTWSSPQVLRLAVPACIEPHGEGVEGPEVAVGFFSLNLRQHLELEPQTYAIWSVAGGELRGPVLAALVAPETLASPRR